MPFARMDNRQSFDSKQNRDLNFGSENLKSPERFVMGWARHNLNKNL